MNTYQINNFVLLSIVSLSALACGGSDRETSNSEHPSAEDEIDEVSTQDLASSEEHDPVEDASAEEQQEEQDGESGPSTWILSCTSGLGVTSANAYMHSYWTFDVVLRDACFQNGRAPLALIDDEACEFSDIYTDLFVSNIEEKLHGEEPQLYQRDDGFFVTTYYSGLDFWRHADQLSGGAESGQPVFRDMSFCLERVPENPEVFIGELVMNPGFNNDPATLPVYCEVTDG